jgi:hypothetical protein
MFHIQNETWLTTVGTDCLQICFAEASASNRLLLVNITWYTNVTSDPCMSHLGSALSTGSTLSSQATSSLSSPGALDACDISSLLGGVGDVVSDAVCSVLSGVGCTLHVVNNPLSSLDSSLIHLRSGR